VGDTVIVPNSGLAVKASSAPRDIHPTAQVGGSWTSVSTAQVDSAAHGDAMSAAQGDHSSASAALFNTSSVSELGYAASLFSVDASNSCYRSQCWELKRRGAILPGPLSLPVSGFEPISSTSGKKRLPPGVRRTRRYTFVTTQDGLTAQYCRRSRRFADWEHLDGNACYEDDHLVFPDDASFESSIDEDEYSLDLVSCTSDFSFTAHPADYEEYGGVLESDSFHNRYQSFEEEFRDVFRLEYDNTPTCLADVSFRDLRGALFSLSGQVDSNINHNQEAYRRIRLTDERLTRTRDALCRHTDITLQWMNEVRILSDELQSFRETSVSRAQVGEMIQTALVLQREELLASVSGMITDAISLLPPEGAQPGGRPRESFTSNLANLERSIKKRISDHAARVTTEARRRSRPPTPVQPTLPADTRPPTPSGWSTASVSQMGTTHAAPTGGDAHTEDLPRG